MAAPLVLLTGATGFVGRQVLQALRDRGCRVRAVVREGKRAEADEVAITSNLWAEKSDWYARVCDGVDTVLHAAWYAEPGQYLQSAKNFECLSGTLELTQGAAAAKVRRFVGIGTCFEYDLAAGDLSVMTPLAPATAYASAKAAVFTALSLALPPQGVSFAWCRLFYLHGEGEDVRRFVPYLRGKLAAGEPVELSRGDQVRDYLDVRDAARMIVDAALGDAQGAVNVCSGKAITIRQFAETIADEYGRRDLLRFGARADNLTDPPRVVGIR